MFQTPVLTLEAPNAPRYWSVAVHLSQERSWVGLSSKDNPVEIYIFTWTSWPFKLWPAYSSTCLLINPHKQFDSFGFEAEEKYFDLTARGENKGWMLFKEFTSVYRNFEVFILSLLFAS